MYASLPSIFQYKLQYLNCPAKIITVIINNNNLILILILNLFIFSINPQSLLKKKQKESLIWFL